MNDQQGLNLAWMSGVLPSNKLGSVHPSATDNIILIVQYSTGTYSDARIWELDFIAISVPSSVPGQSLMLQEAQNPHLWLDI